MSETDTNERRSAGYGAAAMAEAPYLRTVRAAYDAIAEGYAERFAGELEAKPRAGCSAPSPSWWRPATPDRWPTSGAAPAT